MPRSLASAVAGLLVLLCAGRAPAQGEAEARALVERAVKAKGGRDKIGRKLATHRKRKGVFHNDGFTFTGETFSEPGDRVRIELRGSARGRPGTRALVFDGTKGWRAFDGATYDLDGPVLERFRESIYTDRVCGLVTLLRDKGYTLQALGEEAINGKPARGVKVQSEGKPDVLLYFDKESGLLVKSSSRVNDPDENRLVNQEVYYHDYRLLDPAAADEQAIRSAKRSADGPALLELLRKRIPAEAEQVKMRDLIVKLGHRSFGVRQRATAELKQLGLRAAPLLRQAARDKDGEVARRARQCLELLAGDPDIPLAAAAVRLLAMRRPPGAAEALLDYGPWAPDEAVAREVQSALAALADEGGKRNPALMAALKDRDPRRREAAAAALGEDGGAYLKRGWRRVYVTGVRIPMRVALYRDGKLSMDLETTELQFFNRLDDSLFTTRP